MNVIKQVFPGAIIIFFYSNVAFQKITVAKPVDKSPTMTIDKRGSQYYHFEKREMDSTDKKRHYRVWTVIPNKPAPKEGYNIIYMLDGNAVMRDIDENLLSQLSDQNPPVIVAVGYQTTMVHDGLSRTYDYTPPAAQGSPLVPLGNGRMGGGNSEFINFMEKEIIPSVEKTIQVNKLTRSLWGHSYGGLFVLSDYLNANDFKYFYAASPSLSWDNYSLPEKFKYYQANSRAKELCIMRGRKEFHEGREDVNEKIIFSAEGIRDALNSKGLKARFILYNGLSHGQMFTRTLRDTLIRTSSW